MDILSILLIFFLFTTIVKISTDNVDALMKPLFDVKKYKMIIALLLTLVGIFGLNRGIFETLNVPIEVSRSWFHYFDLVVTSLFLTGGAQAIHKLNNAWKQYKEKVGEQS
ncbi:MAG: hypothetical protein JXR88_12600 [Clostridia bacterium]|nr:hypothetical protein [Clostridia bacterium]